MNCERYPHVEDPVIYHDARGEPHDALITEVWGTEGEFKKGAVPCVNLVFVSRDKMKSDSYGRQIERETSVVHGSQQGAHGRYWRWPAEKVNPVVACQS